MENKLKKSYQDYLNANSKRIGSRFQQKVGHTASKSLLEKIPKSKNSLPIPSSNRHGPTAIPSLTNLQKLTTSNSLKPKSKPLQALRSASMESKPKFNLNLKEILHKKLGDIPKSDRNFTIRSIPKSHLYTKALSMENSFTGIDNKKCFTSREFVDSYLLKEDKENLADDPIIYKTSENLPEDIRHIQPLTKSPYIPALCKNNFEVSLVNLEAKLTIFYNSLAH